VPAQRIVPLAPPSGPEPTCPTAILETTVGSISCRLFARESPIATRTGCINPLRRQEDIPQGLKPRIFIGLLRHD
jgi:hypothetical protein